MKKPNKFSLEEFQEFDPTVLLSKDHRWDFRRLKASYFRLKIPLEARAGKASLRAIEVVPLDRSTRKLVQGLLWHALFGRKSFKSIHWFLLFKVLESTTDYRLLAFNIYAILKFSNTGKPGAYDLHKCHRSVKSSIARVSPEQAERCVSRLLTSLKEYGMNLPKKAPNINELFLIRKSTISQSKPRELSRIGVGYKDQGNLGDPGTEYDPSEPTWLPHMDISVWEELELVFLREFGSLHKQVMRDMKNK